MHEHQIVKQTWSDENVLMGDGTFTLDASGNYVHAPGKFVAAVGVRDLVIVETDDADRPDGLVYEGSRIHPAAPALWG